MADSKDDGKVGLPSVGPGMTRDGPGKDVGKSKPGSDQPDKGFKPLGRKGAEKDDAALLKRIRSRFDRCSAAEAANRKDALDDLKFKAGDQWPADVMALRNADKRPCLTINKLPTFIHQVTNDQRQNRPSIDVAPVGDKGDVEAAKMFRGLIRAIERDSSADIAYDTAFDNAVSNGFGYFRLLTEFEEEGSFDQVIRIKRVRNPFTVYLDPDHQEPDGADCRYGFVTEIVPKNEFEDTWPDAVPVPFDQAGSGEKFTQWVGKDGVRIAEYFEIKTDIETLIELDNGHVGWKADLSEDGQKIGVRREREAERHTVKWYKVTAVEVLERGDWLGQWIPIIPVIGNEIDIEGKVRLSGLIRDAKDSQRMYNYWATSETETVALSPKAPFIMEEGQIEGHEPEWKQANTKSMPVLTYKGTNISGTMAPPPQRQPPPPIPAGIVNARQSAAQDMVATTGIRFDVTMDNRMVDESGRAIRELRRSGDLGAFHYVDNLARSLKHCGRQLIDLIPKIYDEKRVITILREDDTEETVHLDPHAAKPYEEKQQGQDAKKRKIFNPTTGKYGVTVTVGPSYATKRVEAAESMMMFAKAMPQTAMLIADLIAKNQDWPGAEEMAARLAKAVPPQLMTPDQKDIPPQVQAFIQSLEGQLKQMGQQLQAAMKEIGDKDKDRDVAILKINSDFEAKLIGILQKADSDAMKHIGGQVQGLADQVGQIAAAINAPKGDQPQPEGQSGQAEEQPDGGQPS